MLKVERHNYEEYFLLYVDNELNAEQRLAVEDFVAQNEDLRVELEMVQQTILSSDTIRFKEKESLLKKESGISIHNYEAYFLLSVDDELNSKEKDSVEKFVLQHPNLQDEFTFLHQTKLKPETLVFKNKEVLLRKERRVVPIFWMRMSVAAAVLGIIVFSWIARYDNGEIITAPVAVNNPASSPIKENKSQKNIELAVTQNTVDPLQSKAVVLKVKTKSTLATKTLTGVKAQTKKQDQIEYLVQQKYEQIPKPILPDNSISLVNIKKDLTEIIEPKVAAVATENKINNSIATNAADLQMNGEQPNIISPAVYKESLNTDEEDKTVYIGNLQINKNKIKSLFKKASGIFAKKAEKNPNGKSVQIAGFKLRTT